MIDFSWPWMALLLPMPIFCYWLLPSKSTTSSYVFLPYLPDHLTQYRPSNYLTVFLLVGAWLLLIGALCRPIWYGNPIESNPEHRDMLLTLDLSGSMAITDMWSKNKKQISRLQAVKNVLVPFIEQRQGDRLGLVIFANHAYLQTPLTFDVQTVKQQLLRTELGLIGRSTAMGEGLGVAIKTLLKAETPQKIVILLSDGANTSGIISPEEAMMLAKEKNIVIYTIGIGSISSSALAMYGQHASSKLDERLLKTIAHTTKGQYFYASNPKELFLAYDTIQKLHPTEYATRYWRPQKNLFHYPLSGALLFAFLLSIHWKRHYG